MLKILDFRNLQNRSHQRFWTFGAYKTDHAKDFRLSEPTKPITPKILDFRSLRNRSRQRFWTFGAYKSINSRDLKLLQGTKQIMLGDFNW